MSGDPTPLPGGGVPIRQWEEALTELDESSPEERSDRAHELLSRLEDALGAL